MNLSEIRRILDDGQIQLTKSLGQNFLHDANQLHRIVEAARLGEHDRVLEIGPGLGALTQFLLEKGPHLLAIEKDKRLSDVLKARFAQNPRLEVLEADALAYLKNRIDWSAWKVVSNLPYSVASPILVELAKAPRPPMRIVATLQMEVAQRIIAEAGQEHYGLLSLLLQLRYEPRALFKIPATCFFPVPGVDSACVTLERRSKFTLNSGGCAAFEKIAKRSFSQRRKMMLKLLKADWPLAQLEQAFAQIGILPKARAETITLQQYIHLTHLLTGKPLDL